MGKKFEVIQDTPYCSNCGESEWRKNKKGETYCAYCGYLMTNTKNQNKDNFKNNIKQYIIQKRCK